MNTKKHTVKREALLPKIAKKIGEHSVNQVACMWWWNQPKVPDSIKNDKK